MCRYRSRYRGRIGRCTGRCTGGCTGQCGGRCARGWPGPVALLLCAFLLTVAGRAECDEFDQWLPPVADESLAEDGGEENAVADWLIREAAAFRANPIDLNSCSLSDLLLVPFIDPVSAAAVLQYREEKGELTSLRDLVGFRGLTVASVDALAPYVMVPVDGSVGGVAASGVPASGVTPSGAAVQASMAGSVAGAPGEASGQSTAERGLAWSLTTRLSGSHSSPPDPGLAFEWEDPLAEARTCIRLRVSRGDRLTAGVAFEKDPGESKLADHVAAHITWDSPHGRAVAGDFNLRWGQGLIAGSQGLATAERLPVPRDRIKGYDGMSETTARRGIVATGRVGRKMSLGFVAARTQLDATIDDNGRVTSVRASGYHRTESERAGKEALAETISGGRVTASVFGDRDSRADSPGQSLNQPSLVLGASLLRFSFDPPLAHGDPLRQRYRLSGAEVTLASLDAVLMSGDWRTGVEFARSTQGGSAFLAGVRARSGAVQSSFGCGYQSESFRSPLGSALPGTSGGTNALSGWLRLSYTARGAWRIWGAARATSHPWRTYHNTLPEPSGLVELGTELNARGLGRITFGGRLRARSVEDGEPEMTGREQVRTQWVILRASGAGGLRLAIRRSVADLNGIGLGTAVSLSARSTTQLTESVAIDFGAVTVASEGRSCRIPHYEPGLTGEMGLRTLNDPGTRWYIRARTTISRSISVAARLAGGPSPGRLEFGIGLDIQG